MRERRVAFLKREVDAAGGAALFARAHPGVDPTYVSQLLNGHRSFGERAARKMEQQCGWPPYAMDGDVPKEPGAVAKATKEGARSASNVASVKPIHRGGIQRLVSQEEARLLDLWRLLLIPEQRDEVLDLLTKNVLAALRAAEVMRQRDMSTFVEDARVALHIAPAPAVAKPPRKH